MLIAYSAPKRRSRKADASALSSPVSKLRDRSGKVAPMAMVGITTKPSAVSQRTRLSATSELGKLRASSAYSGVKKRKANGVLATATATTSSSTP